MNKISKKEKVDWKKFIEAEDEMVEDMPFEQEYEAMVKGLERAGILSLESTGNYQIRTDGLVLSPKTHGHCGPHLYFTRRSDAEKYVKLNYSDAMYEVTIDKIEKEFVPKRLK